MLAGIEAGTRTIFISDDVALRGDDLNTTNLI